MYFINQREVDVIFLRILFTDSLSKKSTYPGDQNAPRTENAIKQRKKTAS